MSRIKRLLEDLERVTKEFRLGLGLVHESKSLVAFIENVFPIIKDEAILCGGLLVSEYGNARATQDLDVFVLSSSIGNVTSKLKENGFQDPEVYDYTKQPKTFIYKFKKDGIDLDCIYFGDEDFNLYINKNKRKSSMFDFTCYVLDINSFIITKLISGRYKDLGDIENIVETSNHKINLEEIKSWCSKLKIMNKYSILEDIIQNKE